MVRKIPKYNTQAYWKGAHTYQFDTTGKDYLHVFAYDERAAKTKATLWGKWLRKTKRGKDRAIPNSIKRIF